MTEIHRMRLNSFEELLASAGSAKDQFRNGDRQISIAHLRRVIAQATHLIEDLSHG